MLAPLRDFAARFPGLFRRRRLESRIEEELRFHLQMEIEANRGKGMNPEDALNAALRSLGGIDQAKEKHRRPYKHFAVQNTRSRKVVSGVKARF